MNVVIDGDSVAKLREDNWSGMFAAPDLYILQLGQWSYHNESAPQFTDGMSRIISAVHDMGVPVILCTPTHMAPHDHPEKWTVRAIHDLARRYNTALVDFYSRLIDDDADESWFLEIDLSTKWVCHLNARGSREAVTYFDKVIQPYEVNL